MSYTQEQIEKVMQERGVNRKSAVQYLRRNGKKATPAPAQPETTPVAAAEPEPTGTAVAGDPNVDFLAPGSLAIVQKAAKAERKAKTKKAAKADKAKGKPGRISKVTTFDPAKAVELYKAGQKVVDIAVAMGYPRTHGQNRVRAALLGAGVYKGKGGK